MKIDIMRWGRVEKQQIETRCPGCEDKDPPFIEYKVPASVCITTWRKKDGEIVFELDLRSREVHHGNESLSPLTHDTSVECEYCGRHGSLAEWVVVVDPPLPPVIPGQINMDIG